MNDLRKHTTAMILFAVLLVPTMVNAALVGRLAATEGGTDYQAYYDTEADLTWLTDANYAMTSGFDADGRMNWEAANSWAAGLSIGGVDGWRLADIDACLNNCGSELGNLFGNVLGGTGYSVNNESPFINIQFTNYWLASEWGLNTGNAWYFMVEYNAPTIINKGAEFFSWAVYSGDVSAVPAPSAIWLFVSGLLCLIGFTKHKYK